MQVGDPFEGLHRIHATKVTGSELATRSLDPDGTLRVRRPAQRREVVAVQRAGRRRRARRAVRVRHHRPERRRGQGARRPPRPAGRDASSKKVVPASVQFVDIGGLVEGASKGEGLGNRFLAHIREVDAVVFVLRAFDDADVPGPDRPARPPARRRDRARPGRPRDRREPDREAPQGGQAGPHDRRRGRRARRGARAVLSEGTPIYRSASVRPSSELLRGYFLLTNKPVLAVVNVGEDQLGRVDAVVAPVAAELGGRGEVLGMCVQLEAEAAQLDGERARPRCSRRSASARARCPASCTPPTTCSACARSSPPATRRAGRGRSGPGRRPRRPPGVIHTDFERGFIRAEVIHWDELLDIGSWSKAREVGKLRVEGKDYEVADGDVLEIRFNVVRPGQPWIAGGRGPTGPVRGWSRDGEVLASLEVADDRRARAAGLLGRDGFDGALLLPACPVGAHLRHALPDRRRLLRRRRVGRAGRHGPCARCARPDHRAAAAARTR